MFTYRLCVVGSVRLDGQFLRRLSPEARNKAVTDASRIARASRTKYGIGSDGIGSDDESAALEVVRRFYGHGSRSSLHYEKFWLDLPFN